MEAHTNSRGTAGANKRCQGLESKRYAVHNMFFFALLLLQTRIRTECIDPEPHFQPDTIGASPAVIARKKAKLFNLLYQATQCSLCVCVWCVLLFSSCHQSLDYYQ